MPELLDKDLQFLEMDFLPLSQMLEIMKARESMPYPSRFSFEPYIKSVSSRMSNACAHTKGALNPVLKGSSDYIESGEVDLDEMFKSEHFQTLVGLVVPSLFFKDDKGFIAEPFRKNFLVTTTAYSDLMEGDEWEVKVEAEKFIENKHSGLCQAGMFILNKFYDQKLDIHFKNIITLRNRKSRIEKHYQISLKFDFVEATNIKPLPKLSQKEINHLIANIDDEDIWLKKLPPDHFEFKGFATGQLIDVTDLEVMSQLKHWLNSSKDNMNPEDFIDGLTGYMKSYLDMESLRIGSIMTEYEEMYKGKSYSLTGRTYNEIFNSAVPINGHEDIYHRMVRENTPIIVEDISLIKTPSENEQALSKNGINSLLLAPIISEEGKVLSVLEFGSTVKNIFHHAVFRNIRPALDVLKSGYDKYIAGLEGQITNIIQDKYTSIHPSVQWKFQEVALKHMISNIYDQDDVILDSIVFNDVYPLYAQSDIVGSSIKRNLAIQEDLIQNLELLSEVLAKYYRKQKSPLIDSYQLKISETLSNLREHFVSNDETEIVNLITRQVHPLLEKLKNRHPEKFNKTYSKYNSQIDPELKIIYNKRKDFEQSVHKLNSAISDLLEKDNQELQKTLPHYFEKYKTDGVEYNMYVGKSILENGDFDNDDIRNFRLWQLINTCEIVRLVEETKPQLHTPLDTASLIFVYNHPLSIRFRMDEKRFDVDGAYNVRYEILKKRIDKAYIKGTNERLTVAGKIAIVYLSDQDKAEYLEFFDYLKNKGYIKEDYEDLELDRLQGAEGLKALRITVS